MKTDQGLQKEIMEELAGTVSWDYERKAAVDIVNKIIGVKGIINKIQLQCMSLDSEEIKNKISIAFRRSAMIDSANVKVEVLGDSVVLIGKVKSWAEKMEAENVAWSSPGVQSVESFIKVDSTPLFA